MDGQSRLYYGAAVARVMLYELLQGRQSVEQTRTCSLFLRLCSHCMYPCSPLNSCSYTSCLITLDNCFCTSALRCPHTHKKASPLWAEKQTLGSPYHPKCRSFYCLCLYCRLLHWMGKTKNMYYQQSSTFNNLSSVINLFDHSSS